MKEKKIIISYYFHCHCVNYSQLILLEKANTEIHQQKFSKSENMYLSFYTPNFTFLHNPCYYSTAAFGQSGTLSKYWLYNMNKCHSIIILAVQ